MSDLIDRKALLKDISENYVFVGFEELRNDIIEIINKQPTVIEKTVVNQHGTSCTNITNCGNVKINL